MKQRFINKYEDPGLKDALLGQLEKCVQAVTDRVHEYTERFQSLVMRISGGQPIDTQSNIILWERGFIPDIRLELAKYRSSRSQQLPPRYKDASLTGTPHLLRGVLGVLE